jgi:choline dehydrogenase-like flavoprotein
MHAQVGCRYGNEAPSAEEHEPWMANCHDGRTITTDDAIECDVVIVGSGAGGAALAHDLASRGHAVVVLETGRYFKRRDFDGRPLPAFGEMYLDGGMTLALGNIGVPVWAGQTVGGSTTINSGTCYPTPPRVLERWRREGLAFASADGLGPYFARVESMLQVETARPEHLGAIGGVIARGADALGWSHGPLRRNAPGCDGQGLCCFGCPSGAKRSADVSWIPAALARGAQVFSSSRVERIDADPASGRALGVTARTAGGATLTIRARATVVACGALMTPVLLAKSDLCTGSPMMGRNLSIHPAGKAMALLPDRQDMWRGIPQSYTVDEFADEGMLFEGGSLPFSVATSNLPTFGARYMELMDRYPHLASFGYMIEDHSRGRVMPRPGSNGHSPMIVYQLDAEDALRVQLGMERLIEIFLAAGAEAVLPGVVGGGEIRSRADLDGFRSRRWDPSRFELTAYHPLGTARMGVDPRTSVVGPDHETHDVRDLYVVDGAAVPGPVGVNPQMTIMALALRAGAILDRRLS